MPVKIKQLKQHDEIFYPVTVGRAVIFEDSTNAEVSELEMEEIFGWIGNYMYLTETYDTDNYIEVSRLPLNDSSNEGVCTI